MDIHRVKKLLWLTQSDSDNEALSAIRAINKMLKSAGKTWDDVFKFETIVVEKVVLKAPRKTKEKLEWCVENCGKNQKRFVEDLHSWYETRGSLTPRQMEVLNKIYDGLCG